MKQVKTLLLGGGISSVSYAHFTEDDDYLILEKEDKLGGLCRSFKVGDSTFDFSGHFMHYKDKAMQAYVEKLVNKHTPGELREYDRVASIGMIKDGKLDRDIDYPFQANIHQLDKADFIKCLVDLYESNDKYLFQEAKNFDELVRMNFGDGITDLFFKPYNEKMYCAKLEDMSADAMKRFIPEANFGDVMTNIKASTQENFGYNSKFLYLPETGIQGLVDSFVAEKDIVNYLLNTEVVDINIQDKVVTYMKDGQKTAIQYERLINTLPLNKFIPLTGDTVPDEFKSMDVHIFNLTYDSDCSNINDRCWTYFPHDDVPFYRVGFYNYMSGKKETSLYVEVSSPHGETTDHTVESIDKHLKDAGIIFGNGKLVDTQELKISPAYVIISPYSESISHSLLEVYRDKDIHSLGRYGLWTYQSIEDNILDAKELATNLA
jgi:protoporphyrinogen oxidase